MNYIKNLIKTNKDSFIQSLNILDINYYNHNNNNNNININNNNNNEENKNIIINDNDNDNSLLKQYFKY